MARGVHVCIGGSVQGVGFRAFVAGTARRLRLSGWVRNLADGRVELEAEGDDSAIAALLAAVHQGPRAAQVDEVQVEERSPGRHSGPFTVR